MWLDQLTDTQNHSIWSAASISENNTKTALQKLFQQTSLASENLLPLSINMAYVINHSTMVSGSYKSSGQFCLQWYPGGL